MYRPEALLPFGTELTKYERHILENIFLTGWLDIMADDDEYLFLRI